MESDVSVIKNVNNILSKQTSSIERQCWKNAQYSRHECVEVVGLSLSVEDKELEPTFCRMLQHIGVDITEERFEACHRLNMSCHRYVFFSILRIISEGARERGLVCSRLTMEIRELRH